MKTGAVKQFLLGTILFFLGFGSSFTNSSADETHSIPVAVHGIGAEKVAARLRTEGIEAEILSDAQLADGNKLNADRYRVLLLLSAPDFPFAARDNFLQYLRDGGNFLASGGMAFDNMQQEAFSGELLPAFDQWFSTEAGDPDVSVSFDAENATIELKRRQCNRSSWLHVGARIPADSDALYLFSGAVRSGAPSGGVGGYAAIRYLDSNGKKIGDLWLRKPASRRFEWFEKTAAAPAGTAFIEYLVLLNGNGESALHSPSARRISPERLLNARYGTFSNHGGIALNSDQLPIFDPTAPFCDAVSIQPVRTQNLIDPQFRFDGSVEGFPVTVKLGSGDPVTPRLCRTWMPLIETFDRFGKARGAAGAIVHNYAGTFYRSSWALFGVSNFDLWSDTRMLDALPALVRSLADPVFLATATPEYYSFRTGENAKLTTRIISRARSGFNGKLTWTIRDRERTIRSGEQPIRLKPGAAADLHIDLGPVEDSATLHKIEQILLDDAGTIRSVIRTGFVHFQPEKLHRLPWNISDNYFSKPGQPGTFLLGSNQTGAMFYSPTYAPNRWADELDAMRDHNLHILRVLHITPSASPEYHSWNDKVDVSHPSENFLRKLDALVALSSERGILLTLDVSNGNGYNPLYGDDAFQRQGAEFVRTLQERYRNAGRLLFDFRNEPQLYVNYCKLFTPELKELYYRKFNSELTTDPISGGFENRTELDRDRFIIDLFRRYIDARNAVLDRDAIRLMGYSAHRQITLVRQFAGELSLNDAHFNRTPPDEMRLTLYDQRYIGTPPSIGEFGFNLEPYLSDRNPDAPMDEYRYARLLRETALYAFSRGAASVCNWSLRDLDESIFPSGLWFPQNGGAKRAAEDFGHIGWFLGSLPLAYLEPETALLYPANGAMGGDRDNALERIATAADALERASIDFTVVNDDQLRNVNPRLRCLIYPSPGSISDDAFETLQEFVRSGGCVFLSGDLSFDENHQHTRIPRFESFCGVRRDGETCRPVTARRIGDDLYENRLGSGCVIFTPRSIENDPPEILAECYRKILARWDIAPLVAPPLQAALQHGPDGERYCLLRNRTDETASAEFGTMRFTLPPGAWGLAGFNKDGALFALLLHGSVEDAAGGKLFHSDFPVALLAGDRNDIRRAERLEMAAFGAGTLQLANPELARARWRDGNGPELSIRKSQSFTTLSCDDDFIKGRIILEK